MIVSNKIVFDLTENIANVGKTIPFCGKYELQDDLLPYPNAKLVQVKVNFDVTFTNPNVEVCGDVTCVVDGFCDLCLEPIRTNIELPFCQTFYKDACVDEDGYVYVNSKLDATKAVEDEILLSVPTSLVCKTNCKGLCPKCGCNRNKIQCDCDTTKENPFAMLKNIKF